MRAFRFVFLSDKYPPWSFTLHCAQYPLCKSPGSPVQGQGIICNPCAHVALRAAHFLFSPSSPLSSLLSLSLFRERNRSTVKLPMGAEFNSRACATSMGEIIGRVTATTTSLLSLRVIDQGPLRSHEMAKIYHIVEHDRSRPGLLLHSKNSCDV